MDQALAKRELNALIDNLDLGNKTCCDCDNKNPQWASLSHATFICLECAGQHRGFGVHISFVRSVSMDTWQEEQIRRMKLGGNKAFQTFANEYSPEGAGGFKNASSIYEKYHSWVAKQYREKLDAELKGESWSPSLPPADWNSPSSTTSPGSRPSSAQGLRKARGATRPAQGSSLRQQPSSPASFSNSPPPTSGSGASAGSSSPLVDDQKARNEAYFASLGAENASRPADLPPSQGGRYTGFGNTPSQPSNSSNPSFGLSSRSAPTLSDFQDDPGAALSKGWSLFSSVLAGATKTVNESVIQPGLERVRDPNLQASVRGYVDEAGRRVGSIGSQANEWGKAQLGVDVTDSVGGMYENVRDRVAGGPTAPEGYGRLDTYHDAQDWERYDDREGDFFDDFNGNEHAYDTGARITSTNAGYASTSAAAGKAASTSSSAFGAGDTSSTTTASAAKKVEDWDEWKDF